MELMPVRGILNRSIDTFGSLGSAGGGITRRSPGAMGGSVKDFGRNITENLSYPEGVESDAGQGHYIIFEIHRQNKAKLKARKASTDVVKKLIDMGKQVGGNPGQALVGADEHAGLGVPKKLGKSPGAMGGQASSKQSGPNSLAVAQNATTKMPVCIALYMPPSVQVNYNANYGDADIGIMAETGNAAIQAFMGPGAGPSMTEVGIGALKAAGSGIFNKLKAAAPAGTAAVFAINTGSIITPRMELMFEGIQRRTFSFNFTFLPKSEQEAEIVEQIVFQFKYHMASNYGGLGGGADGVRAMEIPDFFNIRYMFGGEDGDLGPKKENMHLNLIKQCVLTSAGVEYGSDQYKSYAGGRPQTTKLNLSFSELEIITKDYIAQGY